MVSVLSVFKFRYCGQTENIRTFFSLLEIGRLLLAFWKHIFEKRGDILEILHTILDNPTFIGY